MDDLVLEMTNMSTKAFFAIVDRDTRDALPGHQSEALRADPLLVERWYQTLVSMKRSVEGTLAAKNSEAKADRLACIERGDEAGALDVSMKHHRWRAGAMRFATGVSEKLSEARFHRLRFYPEVIGTAAVLERNLMAARYHALLDAVRLHRDDIKGDADADPSQADVALWSHLPD